ncbi:MAG: LynF/TruF/PatF family peptide O-prenyltransferase [Moorea sp. SIO1G6]|uniref:DUF5838 family protein n=1 Tax=Moorena sp. SIO1G6 TaxID=2607840 RepID=UPI0013C04FD2|nr:DUF5838 family protein [Moorena sp. SIO1G6]NES82864.1 LynF/TruF/PatF family peptide O-prenyltransferase [Moorena sp. SIO2B7]NET65385.1 LynF/TruF/PatF family peptide O-prenyltransferase [Moorena sp. SIO1G6]
MTSISVIQRNFLREQRLHFIRAHQNAFDVNPIFPLQHFEEFVGKVTGDCAIEASCKIENDQLIASRFLLFYFRDAGQAYKKCLQESIAFFSQVESQVQVKLNYDIFQKFLGKDFDWSKVMRLTTGVDLRSNLPDSSLKFHFRVKDYPEKIDTALRLSSIDKISGKMLNSLSKFIPRSQLIPQIGFDFYLNGRTEIELYLELFEKDFLKPEIQSFLQQRFPKSVLTPLEDSQIFHIGLSQANANPVLYYRLKSKHNLLNHFRLNDAAQRVHSFYHQQETVPYMWVGVAEKELKKTRIENIRLYYFKSFKYENSSS